MSSPDRADVAWLRRFYSGDHAILEKCYRDHFSDALAVAARILTDVDAETVTHEVFFRLLTDEAMRASFDGGNFGAWVARVARNAAIDVYRRLSRETVESDFEASAHQARIDDEVHAKLLVERFRKEKLPAKLAPVFEARFIEQLPQRRVAEQLGLQRSTLVYQEGQVRELLREFLLSVGEP